MGGESSEFARQLRSLRQAQGLTVLALAEAVGVSKVTIWKWEKGDTQPRARMIPQLAKALHVTPGRLQFSEDIPGPQHGLTGPAAAQDHADQAEILSDVIATAKRMIAEASGANPQNITISIEY